MFVIIWQAQNNANSVEDYDNELYKTRSTGINIFSTYYFYKKIKSETSHVVKYIEKQFPMMMKV